MVSDAVAPRPGSAEARAVEPRINRRVIALPLTCAVVVDVLFDDVRVFSIGPDHGKVTRAGRRRVEWPSALRRYLRGSTRVTVRAHLTREVVAEAEVRFSRRTERVRVVDAQGQPLALNKWGHLERPFEGDNPAKGPMLAATAEVVAVLNDVIGVPAFIAYGTLLGAVRGGRLIGHDTDVDVAYYSRWDHPADIMRESFAVQRRLTALGWKVSRRSGALLQVRKMTDGVRGPRVDVFTAYHCGDWFAIERWVRGRLPRESVLPLGEVELEGMRFPAPHDPEAMLSVIYGEGWRVPDPAFTFGHSGSIHRRSEGWFGLRADRVRWRTASRRGRRAPREPSAFARHVHEQLGAGTTVVDVGCGFGADAVWFARDGRRVIGLDYVPDALGAARRAARQTPSARFEQLNLNDLRQVLATGTRLGLDEPDLVLYGHHLVDSLRSQGRANLWLLAKVVLGGGGHLFLEFHTRHAADGSDQRVAPPLLRGVDPEVVVAEVTARGGRVTSRSEVDRGGRRTCRLAIAFARGAGTDD